TRGAVHCYRAGSATHPPPTARRTGRLVGRPGGVDPTDEPRACRGPGAVRRPTPASCAGRLRSPRRDPRGTAVLVLLGVLGNTLRPGTGTGNFRLHGA